MSDSSSCVVEVGMPSWRNLLMGTGVLALLANVGLTSAMAVQTNRVNRNLEVLQMMELHSAYVEDVETFIDPITKHVEGLANRYTPAGRRRLGGSPVNTCNACIAHTVRTFDIQPCPETGFCRDFIQGTGL